MAFIYNPQTTHITPQFHVVFDDAFSSITSTTPQQKDAIMDDFLPPQNGSMLITLGTQTITTHSTLSGNQTHKLRTKTS
jgi:hypothetical protein